MGARFTGIDYFLAGCRGDVLWLVLGEVHYQTGFDYEPLLGPSRPPRRGLWRECRDSIATRDRSLDTGVTLVSSDLLYGLHRGLHGLPSISIILGSHTSVENLGYEHDSWASPI